MKSLLVAVIVAFCLYCEVSGRNTVKERLFEDLMDDYEAAIDPGNIELSMSVMPICSLLDKESGLVLTNGWEIYTWKDHRLTWKPEDFGGLTKLRIPTNRVWTPDMRQFNAMTSDDDRDDEINAVVMSDGNIIWVPRVTYRSVCKEEGDKLTCDMRVGSWTYDGDNVKLQVAQGSQALDLSYYSSACPLTVESHEAKVVSHTYPCCEEPYPSMDISIVFKQHPAPGQHCTRP